MNKPFYLFIYWGKECMVYDESELDILDVENVKIDLVITHTAPSFCPPFAKGDLEHWCTADEDLAEDVHRERKNMDNLYNYLVEHHHPLHFWYYGHYHASATHLQKDTSFRLLNIMELHPIS